MSFHDIQTQLRSGLITLLLADGTLDGLIGAGRIFDAPQRGEPYPYLVLEDIDTRPLLGELSEGAIHEFTLSAFSRGPSRDEASHAAGRAAEVLMHGPVTLTGNRLVNLTLSNVITRRLRNGRGFRAATALRAVTEPLN